MPCLLAGASGELSILEGKSGLFSVLLVESCLASITFFSAITFLDAVSLGLSTDIDFLIGETVSHRQSWTWSTLQRSLLLGTSPSTNGVFRGRDSGTKQPHSPRLGR